jgi:hypothetical protein
VYSIFCHGVMFQITSNLMVLIAYSSAYYAILEIRIVIF